MNNISDSNLPNHTTIQMLLNAAFQAMLENTKDMVFVKNIDLVYVTASMPFVHMVGKENISEIVHKTDFEIFDDENLANRYVADDRKLLASGENLVDYIEPLTDDNGQARYGSTSKYILRDSNNEPVGILGVTRDITREYIARQHYQQELQYLFALPADTYAAIFIDIDSWRIISQRRQFIGDSTLQSYYTVESLRNATLEAFIERDSEAALFYDKFSPAFLRDIYAKGKSELSLKYLRYLPDGSIRWVHDEIRFLIDPERGHLCAMLLVKDIDAEKREEQDLVMAAKMDKMTMLLNRETTMAQIRQILTDEQDALHALFMIDVDNFKSLNDTFGHQAGDEFLIVLAEELRKCFRDSDIVGRVGGDEFFVLMRNIPNLNVVVSKAQALLIAIQKSGAAYPTIPLSGSVGISLYPANGKTLKDLYAQADNALYQAKRKGKNQFVLATQ